MIIEYIYLFVVIMLFLPLIIRGFGWWLEEIRDALKTLRRK